MRLLWVPLLALAIATAAVGAPTAPEASTPADAVAMLQSTPVSQWDFGITRLNFELANSFAAELEYEGFGSLKTSKKSLNSYSLLWVHVSPTPENRGLEISVHLGLPKTGKHRTKNEFLTDAVKVIERVRDELHVNDEREREVSDGRFTGTPGIAYYFLPASEQQTMKTKTVRDQLEKATTITVWERPEPPFETCTAPLLGSAFTCN
ncbi:MAG TPA: hypothetical protein VEC10_12150 [Steroidobacteraceae bacterium]|nr:hypothetical protein [Steroidobacteraceae bacterium]